MEGGFERDLRVVEQIGVELDFGSGGTSAEEVHSSAFTHHVHCPGPALRAAHGFDDYIRSTQVIGESLHAVNGIVDVGDLDYLMRAEFAGSVYLFVTFYDGDDVASGEARNLDK